MMIKQFIFTVIGKTDVDDDVDVIFCNRLVFSGPNPRLVIRRKKNKSPYAPRLLKIVAETIDTGIAPLTSDPKITYNLADDFSLQDFPGLPEIEVPIIENPINDDGLDPDTPASPGKKGLSTWEHPGPQLPSDLGQPNFDPILDAFNYGAYPKAQDGGDGKPGVRGERGTDGVNGPTLEIWTKSIQGNNTLNLDFRGQKGGNGGKGGAGQNGGNGQNGSLAILGEDSNWIGVPEVTCEQEPGSGGDGGRGGNAGCGGDGGNGGNGGVVKVFYVVGADLTRLIPQTNRGGGGNPGPAAIPGIGGEPGKSQELVVQCTTPLGSSKGPTGNFCPRGGDKQGGVEKKGEDGLDGYYITTPVGNIPQFSWI